MASAHARRLASEIHSNSDGEPGVTDHRNTPDTPPPQSVQLPDSRRGKRIHLASAARSHDRCHRVVEERAPICSQSRNIRRQVGVEGSDRKSNYALEFCAELFCSHALANLQSGGAIASYPSDTLWPQVGRGATGKLRLLSTLTSKRVSAKS
jgi:hypothetical protein